MNYWKFIYELYVAYWESAYEIEADDCSEGTYDFHIN